MLMVLGEFASAAVTNFLLSALIGGGGFIYLSLRDDEIADSVNNLGSRLLEAVDQVLDEPGVLQESTAAPVAPTTTGVEAKVELEKEESI